MSRTHALVTGGAGFIGSHLVERLLKDGQAVTVIDDCSTGSLSNLRSVADHPFFAFVPGTISGCADLARIVRSVDVVYHLAAAVGVELVVRSPVKTIEVNLQETEAILAASCESSIPVLIASTSEVYGKSQKAAFSESDDLLIGPPHLGRWSYACSKLMDEFLALAYAREKSLPVVVARLFNTVGPRQTGRYGMVLPRFIEAARAGKPLRVYGTGEQTRCFCWVEDTVEALARLMQTAAARQEIVNIGSEQEVSILHLAQEVIRLLSSSSPIEFVPYEEAYQPGFEDMLRRKPVVDKLQKLVHFSPQTTLEQIILRTAASPSNSEQ